MKKLIFSLAFLTVLFSCSQKHNEAETADMVQTSTAALTDSKTSHSLYDNEKTRLIKTAHYRFEVKNMKESTATIDAAVQKFPAYISSSSYSLENSLIENKISIRVQHDYFQELLEIIDKQAKFTNFRNVETDDVSKQFVDLDSRLKTKREVEQRYMNILRNKAGTIEELLDAEKQIGALHEEIEASVGQLNYLKDQVSYSSINLEFYESVPATVAQHDNSLATKLKEGLSAGLEGIIIVTVALAYLWPLIIVGVVTLLISIYRTKRMAKVKA